jgi:hypothetical protein
MKKTLSMLVAGLLAVSANAVETNSTPSPAEAKYAVAIEGRTAAILKALALDDTNQAVQVHDLIVAQYRALNAWHGENDAKLKATKSDTNAVAQIHASVKLLHEKFLAALAEHLSPAQIEAVKDKLTYGKVQFTFAGYVSQYPDLTDANKAEILRLLKEAREDAMDGGSAEEKTAVFQRYKGKINNYLSHQGIHAATHKPAAGTETNAVAK